MLVLLLLLSPMITAQLEIISSAQSTNKVIELDQGSLIQILFTDLDDTPNTYASSNSYCLVVNAATNGIEFIPCNTTSSNSSTYADIWITNEGDMDNVVDLYATLDTIYCLLTGCTMTGNTTSSQWFNGKFNWTSADDWNIFDGSTLDFNESKLSTIYYNATQSQIIAGTIDAGTLVDTQHQDGSYDGVTFNFSEAAGAPGLDVRINFTGITDFNSGVMRYKTSSLSGNYPIIQLWNYDTSTWEDYPAVAESESFATITQPVFDSTEHVGTIGVEEGIVQMRLYKASNGNTNNHYYIDWIAISKGYGTPAGEEVDPYSWHRNSDNESGNFTTTGGITGGEGFFDNLTVYDTTTLRNFVFDGNADFNGGNATNVNWINANYFNGSGENLHSVNYTETDPTFSANLTDGVSADWNPLTNIIQSLGSSAKRYLKLWVQDIESSGLINGTNANFNFMNITNTTGSIKIEFGVNATNSGYIKFYG